MLTVQDGCEVDLIDFRVRISVVSAKDAKVAPLHEGESRQEVDLDEIQI